MYSHRRRKFFVDKRTRRYEDHADLQQLIDGVSLTGQPLTEFLYDNVNLSAMVNFLSGLMLTSDVDCCRKNDYAYRYTNGTGQWEFFLWDVDLTFGRTGVDAIYLNDALMPHIGVPFAGGSNALV